MCFFLKCLCVVELLCRISQVNKFIGPELICLFSFYSNLQLRAINSCWFAVSVSDQYTF